MIDKMNTKKESFLSLTARPKSDKSNMLNTQRHMASKKANIETKAIKLAMIHPTGLIISMAPVDMASKTLFTFLSFQN